MRPLIRLGVFAITFSASIAAAGEISGHTAGFDPRYDLYSSGGPGNSPVRNTSPSFVGSPYDLTGVGWNPFSTGQGVTLISPQHFILAAHFPLTPGPGGVLQVQFLNGAGQIKTFNVASQVAMQTTTFNNSTVNQNSDVLLGTLTAPINSITDGAIANYGIPYIPGASYAGSIPNNNAFTNRQILTLGRGDNGPINYGPSTILGLNNITPGPPNGGSPVAGLVDVGSGPTVDFNYTYQAANPGEFRSFGGDSGSGTFLPLYGSLTLLGAHHAVDNAGNPQSMFDTFLPYYIPQLNAAMSPQGFQVTAVPVPEPSSLVCMGLVALAAGARRLRRRAA